MRSSVRGYGDRGPLLFTVAVAMLLLVAFSVLSPGRGETRAEDASPSASATPDSRASYLGPSARAPQPDELHSQWVRQSADPVIGLGQTASVSIVFKNTGSGRWIKGSPSEVRLGVKGDATTFADAGLASKWLSPTRPAAQTEAEVLPGATATFTFDVKGAKRGTFSLALRPVVDGVAWLEDDGVDVTVTVR